jgi:hypothetical protein
VRRSWSVFGLFALILGFGIVSSAPVRAEFFSGNDDRGRVLASWTVGSGGHSYVVRHTAGVRHRAPRHAYAQSRPPRIIVTPRRLRPNAKRHCRSWLVKEYRASGTVIVPRMSCYWD